MKKILVILGTLIFLVGCEESRVHECASGHGPGHTPIGCAFDEFGWQIGNFFAGCLWGEHC